MRALLLAGLLAIPVGLAATPFFTASGTFHLPGGAAVGFASGCTMPGWNGNLGSCLALPADHNGRHWILEATGAIRPSGLTICFSGQGTTCVKATDNVIDSRAFPEEPLRPGMNAAMITATMGAEVRWTFTIL